ncbi:hypothetical protein SLA2020_369830 [Shorea laevis]
MADGDQKTRSGMTGGANTNLKPTDQDSPYYLHPSDDPGRILVTTLLNGDNYHTWRRVMQNALYAKNKIGFVDGTLEKPETTSSQYQAWMKCNSMVLSWILNTVTKELQDSVAYAEIAKEIWNELLERFTQGNASRVHELKLELATLTQQTRSVSAYFTKLKPIWDELQAHEPVPVCTCGCTCGAAKEYAKARETERIHQFLMGLNENFSTTRSQILSMDPLPSLNKVYAMVTKEEKQQTVAASRGPNIEATALAARGPSGRSRCDHCKRLGHTKERCYEIIGYPVNWKPGIGKTKTKGEAQKTGREKDHAFVANAAHEPIEELSNQSPISGLSKEQYDQLISLLGGNTILNHSANHVGPYLEETDWSG